MNKRKNIKLIKRIFISIVLWREKEKKPGHGIKLYQCNDERNNKKDTNRWME
jgi:hypothetical protein